MKIAIIVGSQRHGSQSAKIGAEVARRVTAGQAGAAAECEVIELAETVLPLWDVSFSEPEKAVIDAMGKSIVGADAFVVISPEWHGMVPAALKNFFLHFSGGQLAHKPALLIGVSGGDGGAYPIAELRASSYKNSRICYLPEHLIIRHVESVFNTDGDNDARAQAYLDKRMDFALSLLCSYSDALGQVRETMPDASDFANGM